MLLNFMQSIKLDLNKFIKQIKHKCASKAIILKLMDYLSDS